MRHFFSVSVGRLLCFCWGLVLLSGCTDPYAPGVLSAPPSYLVVDGFLNARGVSTVVLSRTTAIAAKGAAPAEAKATVYLEDEAGTRQLLREAPAGTYTSAALVLDPIRRYRLHLNTFDGKEYASEFVPVKTTPPIDALRWQADNTGLHVTVDAHDATGNTRYYRWECIETWEIRPVYRPSVEYAGGQIRALLTPLPTLCWGNSNSTTIRIAKTTALSQDVVSQFPVNELPRVTERLFSRYSILVQQHALTKEEYGYWELLRKNTESIGSLFDPQPVQVTGNVRCLTNPAALVLGYVGAHSLTEKRIFINRTDLPRSWPVRSGYEDCLPPDTVRLDPPPRFPAAILQSYFGSPDYLPIDALYSRAGSLIGYTGKSRDCIDCRRRGTSVMPSFW